MEKINIVQLVFDFLALAILVLSSKEDIKTRIVPPKYQWALAIVSVSHLIWLAFIEKNTDMALNCLLTGLFVFGVYITMFLIFKSGIGGADTKVTSLMALFLGWQQTICFIVSHSVVALGYAFYKGVAKHETVKSVPLMPYLAIGFVITKVIWLAMDFIAK